MKYKFETNDLDLTFLNDEFPECQFQCFTASIIPDSDKFITAFTCSTSSNDELSSLWEEISSVISVDYQSLLEDEFSRWNIYILFASKETVTKPLHYEIENNKFSARKIVIKDLSNTSTDDTIALLNERILCADITLTPASKPASVVQPFEMSEITNALLLAELPLGNKTTDKDKRKEWIDSILTGSHNNEV